MAGRGIKAGAVVGKTNDKGTDVSTNPHDIGSLFHTWFTALGLNSKKAKYWNADQPLPAAHEDMKPIRELLA
jgi:hypothetical protein